MSKLNLGRDLYLKGRIGWRGLSKDEYLDQSDYKIINATALMDGYVDWDNCGFITKERYYESEEIMLKEGDILISKDGTLGKIGYVKGLSTPCTVASGIFVLRNTIPEKLDFDYLYHVLKSHVFKDFIARNKALGSTISHLYQQDLEGFELELPALSEQKRIANALNIIDNKINNNSLICSNLEAIAKLYFDYWFVQFDFPDENGRPYKSSGGEMTWNETFKRELPVGWAETSIGHYFQSQPGYAFKSEQWSEDGHPVLTIKSITENGIINLQEASYIPSFDVSLSKYSVENGNLIFAMSGNTIGKTGIIATNLNNILINQRVLIIKTDMTSVAIPYLLLRDPTIQNRIIKLSANSAQPNISESDLRNIKFWKIPSQLVDSYGKLTAPLFKSICNYLIEIQQLISLRSLLLPMLMNGQISIKNKE